MSVGVGHAAATVDALDPDGPQLNPDLDVGTEPGAAVDGVAVPLVGSATQGSGNVTTRTPEIGSVKSIVVESGVHGRVTSTVHSYEGAL